MRFSAQGGVKLFFEFIVYGFQGHTQAGQKGYKVLVKSLTFHVINLIFILTCVKLYLIYERKLNWQTKQPRPKPAENRKWGRKKFTYLKPGVKSAASAWLSALPVL
jgi:hypothetical protein